MEYALRKAKIAKTPEGGTDLMAEKAQERVKSIFDGLLVARPILAIILYLFALWVDSRNIIKLPLRYIEMVLVFEGFLTGPYYILSRRAKDLGQHLQRQLILDIVVVSLLIYLFGGSDAQFLTIVYIVAIVYAGLALSRNAAIAIGAAGLLSYLCMIALEYFTPTAGQLDTARVVSKEAIGIWIGLRIALFLGITGLVVFLTSLIVGQHRTVVAANAHLKEAMEKERKVMEQLFQSEKMMLVGELVPGVSHELSNPLSAAITYLQVIQETELPSQQKENLGKAVAQLERAIKITRGMMSFCRLQEGEKKWLEINQVVDSVVALRSYDLHVNNIEIVLNLDKSLPMVIADFHQLQQVLLNLILNAQEAIVKTKRKDGQIKIATIGTTQKVMLVVSDNGPGIPRENIDAIFDPFFSTKPGNASTGLGLPLCKRVIESYDGSISVQSIPSQGATFIIEIPVEGEVPEPYSTQSDSRSPTPPILSNHITAGVEEV